MEEKTSEQKVVEERKSKILNWFKNPFNLGLTSIILVAFVIRIYYFILTKNQALWWDEACYGSIAKNLILHIWDTTPEIIGESMIRPVLFSFILSVLFRIGLTEIAIRFLFVLISTASVLFLFWALRELYDKRVAIIASFIYGVLWIQLFYTDRILVHILAQALLFPSIYFFIKSLKDEINFKFFAISLFLLSLTTLVRYTKGMVFFAYVFIFLIYLISKKFKPLLNYKLWGYSILGLLPLLIFFFINYLNSGNIFPALLGGGYLKPVLDATGAPSPYFWSFLNFIPLYLQGLFYILFLIGFVKVIFELVIGYDLISKDKKLWAHILLILILVITCAFFVFYLKGGEDRYLFPASITLMAFTSIGIVLLWDILKKFNKQIAIILILAILLFGAYQELTLANKIITEKIDSYSQQKQAFLWLKDNSPKNSTLLGAGIYPYAMYYAQRNYFETPANLTDFLKIEKQADYLLVHAFTPSPAYFEDYLQNQTEWEVNNVFFMDLQKTRPIFIIYKRA